MNVFISWSGPRAKAVALALREWLPDVVNAIDPWMSKVDIDGGALWGQEISSALGASDVGIIVVTPENQTAPWLLFEAGALAKKVSETTRVIPYFVGMDDSGLGRSPLTTFQGKKADKTGSWELLKSLNKCLMDEGLDNERLIRAFDRCWVDLERRIREALEIDGAQIPSPPPTDDMVKEILSTVRGMARTQATSPLAADLLRDLAAHALGRPIQSDIPTLLNEQWGTIGRMYDRKTDDEIYEYDYRTNGPTEEEKLRENEELQAELERIVTTLFVLKNLPSRAATPASK